MKIISPLFVIVLLCLSSKALAQPLSAKYTITTRDNQTQTILRTTELNLWRTEKRVAHQYPATGITEGWEYVGPNLIKATRYFDQHNRAIEYPPGERVHGKTESDWSVRFQLLSDKKLQGLELIRTKTYEDQPLHTYQSKDKSTQLSLNWFPAMGLIQRFRITKKETTETWTLTEVETNQKKITQFFSVHDHYQSTDYADIGDDHTDPFLSQMVHLGFIEHGASGFYQAHDQH